MTYLELKQDSEIQEILGQLPTDKNYFNNAWGDSIINNAPDKKEFILASLRALLDEYTATKPTTKGGRIGRFIAKVVSLVSRIIKI